MELVYLWVEEYKNIRNQGFNFSPRFECEFFPEYEDGKLKDDCKLEITPKKYMNIFPNNINVTAIVGENGSGKSSILAALSNSKYTLLVYNEDGNLYYISDKKINIHNAKRIDKNILKHFMLLSWDILSYDEPLKNIFTKYLQKEESSFSYEDNEELYFSETLFSLASFNKEILLLIFKYDENKYKPIFTFNPLKISLEIKNSYNFFFNNEENIKIIQDLSNEIEEIKNKLENVSFEDSYMEKEDIKKYFIFFLCKKYKDKIEFSNIKNINQLENYFETKYSLFSSIIEYLESLKIKFNFIIEDTIYSDKYSISDFREHFYKGKENIFNELLKLEFIELNYENKNEIKLLDLSQGERTIFLQSLLIDSWIYETESDYLFLLFDEIDVSLHPNWQKKQVQELINLLSQYNKIFHLILTSHSPFILSDIPKENVIFLEKYKEKDEEVKKAIQKIGNCKNISKDIKLKTFGANIHTLLSDGFFMSDGLMGEFAKSKINEIKKFYELIQKLQNKGKIKKELWKKSYEKRKTRFNNIQKIIGEPFLQTIIKNYLDELEILFNDKKEFLDKEIKRLQELRKELK